MLLFLFLFRNGKIVRRKIIYLLLLTFVACHKTDNQTDGLYANENLKRFLDFSAKDSLSDEARVIFADSALQEVSYYRRDSSVVPILFKIANRYYNANALEQYKSVSESILKISIDGKDTVNLAKATTYIGDFYSQRSKSDSAYKYYLKSEKLYSALNNLESLSAALLSKATIQYNIKDYTGAEKSSLAALKSLRSSENITLTYDAHNLLGIIYGELQEFDQALKHHFIALKITNQKNLPDAALYSNSSKNNIGVIYIKKKQFEKALFFFNQVLENDKLNVEDPISFVSSLNNKAYSEFKLSAFENLPQDFLNVINVAEQHGFTAVSNSARLHLSEFYLIKEKLLIAHKYADTAYATAKQSGWTNDRLISLRLLAEINRNNSWRYSSEYIQLSDSLQLAERQARNKLARIEYETDELVQQKSKLEEQRKSLIYFAIAIVLVGSLAFVIRTQAAKNRELRLIQDQQRANEEIYQLMLNQQQKVEEVRQKEKKRIAQEIHDGILGKLFGTRMNLGILNDKRNDDLTVSTRGDFIDELKILEQELREISHDLNSEKAAYFHNFILLVSEFINSQSALFDIEFDFQNDPKILWDRIPNISKINLYRILQEAVQNIHKHAGATKIQLAFQKEEDQLKFTITDNGTGFNTSKKKSGIGLQNMRSRIEDSGGSMKVNSVLGVGTTLTFTLPFS